uniref:Uncharacterized protein n=1 Tax=Romanomermis culicivorax TaxID=13658 RepID=A0A915KLR6_ROMCU
MAITLSDPKELVESWLPARILAPFKGFITGFLLQFALPPASWRFRTDFYQIARLQRQLITTRRFVGSDSAYNFGCFVMRHRGASWRLEFDRRRLID